MKRQPDKRGHATKPAFAVTVIFVAAIVFGNGMLAGQSINSTSQNRTGAYPGPVQQQPFQGLAGYVVVAANDLGMHCGDLDQRIASILPPFNVLHAQVLRKGRVPLILDSTQTEVYYSAASNPNDPAQSAAIPASVFKTNFWEANPRTGNSIAYDAMNAYYPPNILNQFPLPPDVGLPVPDLQRLYLGDGKLAADQQGMPSQSASYITTQAYRANVPQPFELYYSNVPFFVNFPFGYTLSPVKWFSAEGIPATPFDDLGRPNAYPLMRVQAVANTGNTLGVSAGTVLASLDTVTPVAGEVNCGLCHNSPADGGNGLATSGKGFLVATRFMDPQFGKEPEAVSKEYAYDLNVLRLHDVKHRTHLETETPVSCQRCHYTPALDLAHVGPKGPSADSNGREQLLHQSFSRVMHNFHGRLSLNGAPLFPAMLPANRRTTAVRDATLEKTCYTCHPGKVTQCFRGAMYNAGSACQDCHGELSAIGNDFSRSVSSSNPGAFIVAGDYYTNSLTPRIPWANEPLCGSCHSGDAISNLAATSNVVRSSDGIRLLQTYRTTDRNAKPIVPLNRRFAENSSGTRQVLYRLSRGHGGVFCEGCHGSTHAEWPNKLANANDNVAATQLQGHSGKLMECQTCHGTTSFSIDSFKGKFDANGLMRGPHGMHPVADANWNHSHKEVFKDSRTPAGTCQACHGTTLQGSPLARLAADRVLQCDEGAGCRNGRITLAKGTMISCNLCHEMPGSRD